MATELNLNNEEDDENNTLGTPVTESTGPSPASGAGAGGAPAQSRPTPTGKPNIQSYLNANQGAGQQLAQGITQGFEKQTNKFGQGVENASKEIQAKADPLKQNLGEQGAQQIQTAFKDPQAILQQEDQLSQFQKLRDQGYKTDIQGLGTQAQNSSSQLNAQLQGLQNTAQSAGTESGRFQLLRDRFGKPTYTSGQQKLDQLFLQAQPGATKSLNQNLGGMANQAGTSLTNSTTATQAALKGLQDLSGQRATEWQNLLAGGTSGELETDLSQRGLDDIGASSQARLAAAQAKVGTLPALQQRLAKQKLTAADLGELGLTAGMQLYDTDLSRYITQNPREATLAGTADAAEVARYRALNQLAGGANADMFGGEQEIGGFNPYEYNTDKLNQNISSRKNYYEVEQPKALANRLIEDLRPADLGSGTPADRFYKALKKSDDANSLRNALTQYENAMNEIGGNADAALYDQFGSASTLREYLNKTLPSMQKKKLKPV